ncbi:ribosome recycling factor [Geitlerinema sp. PCC 9228]|uniref:ribosome recycling factor n=1 Tax=Geitlerinema sp. PCC 9228 TaxID=111611 RepID=UPI0008F987B7|nr:ribosome recycling factor [Geitlerinema sp. PCC 9228]
MKLSEVESSMKKAVEATQRAFNTIRTGRANPSLLDKVTVDYYGSATPLKALANISAPDATTITIQPFDPSTLSAIEKAISISDLGLTPNNDGKVVRLNIPPLTNERRQEFVKLASKYAEEGRVSIRNVRRDAVEETRKREKNGDISQDDSRDNQEKIQKLTDKYISKIDDMLKEKEDEIMTV